MKYKFDPPTQDLTPVIGTNCYAPWSHLLSFDKSFQAHCLTNTHSYIHTKISNMTHRILCIQLTTGVKHSNENLAFVP